jgi:nucleotide-binding universal stress UspA family protein
VVAATDFSIGALRAFEEARWLSQRAGLELQVLHVAPHDAWRIDDNSVEWMRAAFLDVTALLVRRGLPWVELARHAREVSAATVVVGSHGASGVQRLELGSTASRLVTSSPCPVLVVAAIERLRGADESVELLVEHITKARA